MTKPGSPKYWQTMLDDLDNAEAKNDARDRPSIEQDAQRFADWIIANVNDPRLHRAVAVKVGLAIAARKIPQNDVAEVIDSIRRNRDHIAKPGAYFWAGIQRIFAMYEVPW